MTSRVLKLAAVLVAVGSVAAWVVLDPLPWAARSFTVFLLVPMPGLLLLQARFAGEVPEEAEREAVYVSSAVTVWVLAAFAMLAARFSEMTRGELRLTGLEPVTLLVATALTVAAGLVIMVVGRALRLQESDLLEYLLPRTGSEKIAFVGLSLSAGIAEELVFRSFLIAALLGAGASLPWAVALSLAVFAVSHGYQGVSGVIRVALLGAVLTAPYLITGSIYPSIIAHALLDILAGIVLADWLLDRERA